MSERSQKTRRAGREQAVALQYQGASELPTVAAHGVGEVARQIVTLAEQHGIPVHQDALLSEMLAAIKQGEVISPESCRLVAEVLCFLYYVDSNWREAHPDLDGVIGRFLSEEPADSVEQLPEGSDE